MKNNKFESLNDLLEYWGVPVLESSPLLEDDKFLRALQLLGEEVYKGTECGARITLRFGGTGAEWVLCSDVSEEDLIGLDPSQFSGFRVGTIVEGSEATKESDVFPLNTSVEQFDEFMEELEDWVQAEWKEANESGEECYLAVFRGDEKVCILRESSSDEGGWNSYDLKGTWLAWHSDLVSAFLTYREN